MAINQVTSEGVFPEEEEFEWVVYDTERGGMENAMNCRKRLSLTVFSILAKTSTFVQ